METPTIEGEGNMDPEAVKNLINPQVLTLIAAELEKRLKAEFVLISRSTLAVLVVALGCTGWLAIREGARSALQDTTAQQAIQLLKANAAESQKLIAQLKVQNESAYLDEMLRALAYSSQIGPVYASTNCFTDRILVAWKAEADVHHYQVFRGTVPNGADMVHIASPGYPNGTPPLPSIWFDKDQIDASGQHYETLPNVTYYYWVKTARASTGKDGFTYKQLPGFGVGRLAKAKLN